MAHLLVTSMLRVTGRRACGLQAMTCLLPQQASRLFGACLSLASTSTTTGLGRIATFGNLRRLSSSAANLSDLRQQIDERLAELFKDFDISPVFIEPALPSTPAKDVSEAPTYMDQLDRHYAAIIEADTVEHPLISVTHEELVQPILEASKKSPGRRKAVVFTTRGSGTGKTRALVECQLALMQHKDKNVLPIAITFNNKTVINEEKEGFNLHHDADMAYAIMVCSRILSTFYAEDTPEEIRKDLKAMVATLVTRKFELAAKHLFRATLAHTVRRMRQAVPEQPVDTVVLMVDETYMAHEAVGGRGTTKDYSSNLRQALLDEKLFSDETDKVDVALCISSLVPLNFKTESGRAVVALPLSGRVSAPDVVAKWWLPAMLGKPEEDVQRWIASPENELNVKRLQVLAETMAPVPRHLEFALEDLIEHCVDQGGKVQTELDSFRRVMAGVFKSVKARYKKAELPFDVLRAAIQREKIFPVSEPDNSKRSRIEMSEHDIARCIASSLIVNNEALSLDEAFIPEVSLLMAAYCMKDGDRFTGATPEVAEALEALGDDFLQLPITRSGDSLESCTAWMLQLRLLLLRKKVAREVTLRDIFGQGEDYEDLPDTRFQLKRTTVNRLGKYGTSPEPEGDATTVSYLQREDSRPAEAQLPHSQDQRGRFFKALNQSFLAPGEAKLWPNVAEYERFDHLLALNMVVEETDGEAGHQQTQTSRVCKPFLVFIDDKSTHPITSRQTKRARQSQAAYVTEGLLPEAKKLKAPAKDSLLEAFVEGRYCFVYHHTAQVLPQAQRDNVYIIDYKASQRFLGPMAPIYESMRVADAAAERQAGTT